MGIRLRKSVNLGGGARINFSKKGVGGSIGVKGARITKKSGGGVRKTVGIPGTGISYVKENGRRKRKNTGIKADYSSGNRNYRALALVTKILGLLLILPSLLVTLIFPGFGLICLGIAVFNLIASRRCKKRYKAMLAETANIEQN